MQWDLRGLFESTETNEISKLKSTLLKQVSSFETKFKGKLTKINEKAFKLALVTYESILEEVARLSIYAGLMHAKNSKDSSVSKFYQEINEFTTEISSKLVWFEVEFIYLSEDKSKELINSRLLKDYKKYLAHLRQFAPHTLKENEEMILTKKSLTGREAFVRLYDELEGRLIFTIKINNETKKLNLSEISSIAKSSTARTVRKNASKVIAKELSHHSHQFSYILNTLLLDKKVVDEIRKYAFAEEATYLSYDIDKKVVDKMTETVLSSYKICEKYYLAKARLLKSKLYEWDRYSEIFPGKAKKYSFYEAKELILDVFRNFNSDFSEVCELFFKNKWIDSSPKPGKRSGAFCSFGTPSTNPFILVNFNGNIDDASTLAHELGHGIHAYLSKENSYLNHNPSIVIAEIASIFAENLVFEKLLENEKDEKKRLNLLAGKLEGSFATIFRQNAFFLFEKKLHELRQTEGELPSEKIGELFNEYLQKMFGKGLTLTEGHKNYWMYIGHFYHYNFYVFSYVFGELLAQALFTEYKKRGEVFVKDYMKALKAGGSLSPLSLTKMLGVDIEDENFWAEGLKTIEGYVEEFDTISKRIGQGSSVGRARLS